MLVQMQGPTKMFPKMFPVEHYTERPAQNMQKNAKKNAECTPPPLGWAPHHALDQVCVCIGGWGWHKASILGCLPLAVPIGLLHAIYLWGFTSFSAPGTQIVQMGVKFSPRWRKFLRNVA